MPGATTGDPTHDKGHAEKTWQAKEKQDSRDSLDLLEHLPGNKNQPDVIQSWASECSAEEFWQNKEA